MNCYNEQMRDSKEYSTNMEKCSQKYSVVGAIMLLVNLPFAELAGVGPGEEREPLGPAWKAKLGRKI